jgi:hypothetical protein
MPSHTVGKKRKYQVKSGEDSWVDIQLLDVEDMKEKLMEKLWQFGDSE